MSNIVPFIKEAMSPEAKPSSGSQDAQERSLVINRIVEQVKTGQVDPEQFVTDADTLLADVDEDTRKRTLPFLQEAVRLTPGRTVQVAIIDRLKTLLTLDGTTHSQEPIIRRHIRLGKDFGVAEEPAGQRFLQALQEEYQEEYGVAPATGEASVVAQVTPTTGNTTEERKDIVLSPQMQKLVNQLARALVKGKETEIDTLIAEIARSRDSNGNQFDAKQIWDLSGAVVDKVVDKIVFDRKRSLRGRLSSFFRKPATEKKPATILPGQETAETPPEPTDHAFPIAIASDLTPPLTTVVEPVLPAETEFVPLETEPDKPPEQPEKPEIPVYEKPWQEVFGTSTLNTWKGLSGTTYRPTELPDVVVKVFDRHPEDLTRELTVFEKLQGLPHVVNLLGRGSPSYWAPREQYLVKEWIDTEDLTMSFIEASFPFKPEERNLFPESSAKAAAWLISSLEAVAEIHDRGILISDFKLVDFPWDKKRGRTMTFDFANAFEINGPLDKGFVSKQGDIDDFLKIFLSRTPTGENIGMRISDLGAEWPLGDPWSLLPYDYNEKTLQVFQDEAQKAGAAPSYLKVLSLISDTLRVSNHIDHSAQEFIQALKNYFQEVGIDISPTAGTTETTLTPQRQAQEETTQPEKTPESFEIKIHPFTTFRAVNEAIAKIREQSGITDVTPARLAKGELILRVGYGSNVPISERLREALNEELDFEVAQNPKPNEEST